MRGQSSLEAFYRKSNWRYEYMPREYSGDAFHYTSPAGFRSILFDSPPGDIVLWASRYDCLNDMSEGTVAEEIYREVYNDLKVSGEITSDMYDLCSTVTPARTLLLSREENGKKRVSRPECDRFICSLSKNGDSLPMWNYYVKGSQYEGFNLGFDIDFVRIMLRHSFRDKEVSVHAYPVIYDTKEQKQLVSAVLLKLQKYYSKDQETSIRYIISNQLASWKLVFKNECFKHEEEIRIIIDVARRNQNGILQPQPIEVKYRTNHGIIVPYVELRIGTEALASVCMGPLQCSDEQRKMQQQVLREWLNKHGYVAETAYSEVPVRF